jgi:peptide chain release factor 2
MEEPDFWDDADKANRQMKELKNLKDAIAEYDSLKQDYDDVATMIEMGNEEGECLPCRRDTGDARCFQGEV